MIDVIDSIFHGFASVYITYILIHRDISIIHFPLPWFHDSNDVLFFATLARPFSMDVVWIISFINLSFVLRLLGFADMCKNRAKLVYCNDMYVFTNITIFEQILKIRNTTRPHNKPG